jgi:hypothetical protein
MSIKIIKQGDDTDDLYTAEVTASNGTWRSPQPMSRDELFSKLLSLGHNPMEVRYAFEDAGVELFSYGAREGEIRIQPLVRAVLAGERKAPSWPVSWIWRGSTSIPVEGTQSPYSEAKLAYALFYNDRMLHLQEVLHAAECIDRDLPYDGEIPWALLHLRRRGWLAVEDEMYGLTSEGRRAVKEIVDRGEPSWLVRELEMWTYVITGRPGRRTGPVKKLEKWLSDHPIPGDE